MVRTGRLAATWRYALAALISLIAWGVPLISAADRAPEPVVLWWLIGDPLLGLLSFVLIRWRHRRPALVAGLLMAFSFVSASSAGPASWIIGSIASHRRWRLLAVVAPLNVLAGIVQERVGVTEDTLPLWASIAFGCLVVGILTATGYAMGAQRQLVDSYRERALTAEREQQARVAQARAAERTRIAREMHDVLAHRISLVAMHAGALGYRSDLSEEERGSAAKSIEDNAHRALSDLRAVLGVLRDPTQPADVAPERPQPGLDDIAALVAEERAGGMRVRLSDRVEDDVPAATGRHGVPDRAGGADQRAQARTGHGRHGGRGRVDRRRPRHRCAQRGAGRSGSGAVAPRVRARPAGPGRAGCPGGRPDQPRHRPGRRLRGAGVDTVGHVTGASSGGVVRLVVVDDDPMVRAALRMMLGGDSGLDVVAEASDGEEALRVVPASDADVVLMDIRMPVRDGLSATEELLAADPGLKVIVLTTFDTDDMVLRALRIGAAGFLLKDTPPARLVEAIRTVASGQPMLSPSVTAQLIAAVTRTDRVADEQDRTRSARDALDTLTERERDVADAVARGLSNADIAAELYMGVPTVKTHVGRLFTKLGVENRVQVAILVHDAQA